MQIEGTGAVLRWAWVAGGWDTPWGARGGQGTSWSERAGAVAPFPVARGQTPGFPPLPRCPLRLSVLVTVLLGRL